MPLSSPSDFEGREEGREKGFTKASHVAPPIALDTRRPNPEIPQLVIYSHWFASITVLGHTSSS